MHSFILQDWITIRGVNANAINQSEASYLDLSPYQDVSLYLDVREFSGASNPTINFQTAALKEEALFTTMIGTTVNSFTNPLRVPITTANCPVARYVRWQLIGPASAWDITFRVVLAADGLGL